MCFATLATVAGAALSAGSTVMGGVASSNAANYQAQVARNNAVIAEQNASAATAAGHVQAQASGMKNAARVAGIKAAQAANGVDVNTGSALDVQASERQVGQHDSETVLHNAMLQAYGYRTQATNYRAEAGLQQSRADSAIPGAVLSAGGTLLGAAGRIPGFGTSFSDFFGGSGGASLSHEGAHAGSFVPDPFSLY